MKTVVLAFAFALGPCAATLAADYTVATYDVSGMTVSEISASIKNAGPDGYAGSTDLEPPSYTFDFADKGGKCATQNAKITSYEIVVKMPNWTDEGSASSCVVNSYKKMRSALLQHEERHVKLFTDAKPALLSSISGVNLPGACTAETISKLEEAANKAFKAKQASVQKQNDDFDAKTKNGVTDKPPVVLDNCP